MIREEDCVEYFLFFEELENLNVNEEVNTVLEAKVLDIKALLSSYIQQYIWHKDAFNLIPKCSNKACLCSNNEEEYPYLYGKTCYGDNIEDEWFIVFLLMKLTEVIEGLIVKVVDSDGEFLLIQAAEFLPHWASPEKCEGRVYLYRGEVHIVPIKDLTKREPKPNVCSTCKLIRENSTLTIASPAVQKSVKTRTEGYPEKICKQMHKTNAYVPVGVAAILKTRPDFIAPAILAFCTRECVDMKVSRVKPYFLPEDRVMCNVIFTKCLYAMILQYKYNPPPQSGWNLPALKDPDYKAHSLGAKLTCGFEILVAQEKNHLNTSAESSIPDEKMWKHFLKKIQDNGYFHNLLEGSKDYNSLLTKAKMYFTQHCIDFHPSSSGPEILPILRNTDLKKEDFEKDRYLLTPPDNEAWLEVNSNELEKMLENRFGKLGVSCRKDSLGEAGISDQLTKFLYHSSDFEGAEFPNDNSPLEENTGVEEDTNEQCIVQNEDQFSGSDYKIMFDPEQFSSAVKSMLDFIVPQESSDEESDSSSVSDYNEMYSDIHEFQKSKNNSRLGNSKLKLYMDQMDRELALTMIGESFEKMSTKSNPKEKETVVNGDNFKPIDVDKNAADNLMESYKSQVGGPGPAENLLGPMGVKFSSYMASIKKNST